MKKDFQRKILFRSDFYHTEKGFFNKSPFSLHTAATCYLLVGMYTKVVLVLENTFSGPLLSCCSNTHAHT